MQSADELHDEARRRLDAIKDTTDPAMKRKLATRSFGSSRRKLQAHALPTTCERRGSPTLTAITVVLADDHWIVRAGLRALLVELGGVEIVGEASNGREVIEMIAKHQPRLVLMDLVMPVLGGVEATRRIVKEYPNVGVTILSMHTGEEYVFEALRAGASGHVHKAIDSHRATSWSAWEFIMSRASCAMRSLRSGVGRQVACPSVIHADLEGISRQR